MSRQLPHHRRNVRPGRDLGDQLLDLTLGPVGGSFQEPVPVLAREVRGQQGDRRQVKTAIGQHGQEHRMLPRRAGRGDAEIGLGLREVQDLHAVDEHRRKGLAGKEPSLVHLGDVRDDVGLDSPGLAHELGQAVEQLVVRDRLERALVFHDGNIGRAFSTSWERARRPRRADLSRKAGCLVATLLGSSAALRHASPRSPGAPRERPSETCQEENSENSVRGDTRPGKTPLVAARTVKQRALGSRLFRSEAACRS